MDGSANVGANFEDAIDAMVLDHLADALGRPADRVGENPNIQRTSNASSEGSGEKYDLTKDAYVLVLNHYDSKNDRPGSEVDMNKIRGFFGQYRTAPDEGLDVHDNPTLRQVQELMDEVSRKDFSSCSCLIIIIMGYSGKKNFVRTQDGEYSIRNDIIENITENKHLAKKPKMLIVDTPQKDAVDTDSLTAASNKVDTVKFQSVNEVPSSTGSFFLTTFFDVLRENDTRSLYDINMLIIKRAKDHGVSIQSMSVAVQRTYESNWMAKYTLTERLYVLVLYQNKRTQLESGVAVTKMVLNCLRSFRVDRVAVYCNLNRAMVLEVMKKVRRHNFSKYSCLMVIVIGPGGENNSVMTCGGSYSLRNDIVENVTANPTLQEKPKIFIVNLTQTVAASAAPRYRRSKKSSNKVDTIIFQSAYDGPSLKEGFVPMWFDAVNEAAEYGIDEVNMLLNKRAKDHSQTHAMKTTLRKRLILSDLHVAQRRKLRYKPQKPCNIREPFCRMIRFVSRKGKKAEFEF